MQKANRQENRYIPRLRPMGIYFYIFLIITFLFENPSFTQSSNNTITGQELSDKKLNDTGFEMLKMKRYNEAEKLFMLAIIKNPTVGYYYNNLSVVYMNQYRYDKAYNNLLTAISIDPDNIKALSNMAITCFQMYRFVEAYRYYIKAQRTDKEYTEKRFEKSKVIEKIEEIMIKKPDNKKIKLILNYLKTR